MCLAAIGQGPGYESWDRSGGNVAGPIGERHRALVYGLSRCGAAGRPEACPRSACRRGRSAAPPCPGCSRTTVPAMTALPAPSGWLRSAASAASAASAGTNGDQHPLVGHVQRIEPEHLAGRRHVGRAPAGAVSSSTTPTFEAAAISFSALARPPRVGSRSTWTAGPTASRSSSHQREEARRRRSSMVVSKASPSRSRHDRHAVRPIGPLTSTASPARARCGRRADIGLQHADAGRVDVQPVGLAPLHHLRVARHDRHTRASPPPPPSRRGPGRARRTSSPSSSTNPTVR